MITAFIIVGDSRSGSTLLQNMLARYRDIDAAGEICHLETRFETVNCSCGQPISRCDHWSQTIENAGLTPSTLTTWRQSSRIMQRYEEAAGLVSAALRIQPLGRFALPRGRMIADCVGRLLKAKAQLAGAKAIVDSSKDPGHLTYMLHQKHVAVHPIFCIRDGRGNVHSKMTRGNLPADRASTNWLHIIQASKMMSRLGLISTWMRYEQICAPEGGDLVGRFVASAGLSQEQSPQLRHYIGGSPDFSMKTIDEDVRWKSEMSSESLATFERIAGAMNRSLGYD